IRSGTGRKELLPANAGVEIRYHLHYLTPRAVANRHRSLIQATGITSVDENLAPFSSQGDGTGSTQAPRRSTDERFTIGNIQIHIYSSPCRVPQGSASL